MSELPKSAKDYADKFRGRNGVVDFYKFLGVSRKATQDEIVNAIADRAATTGNAADDYWRITMAGIVAKHLTTPEARAAYDKTITPAWRRLFDRANSKGKRISLISFPFFAVITIYRWMKDSEYYNWEPSLFFFLFLMASVLCLLIAFTGLGDWLKGDS